MSLYVASYPHPFETLPELELVGGLRTGSSPRSLPSHRHHTTEITYLVEGTACWWVDGRWWHVSPGSFFVTRPDAPHHGMPNSLSSCALYWLQFDLEGPASPFGLASHERDTLVRLLNTAPAAFVAVRDPAPLLERILRAAGAVDSGLQALRVRSALVELLVCVSDSLTTMSAEAPGEQAPVFRARQLMLRTLRQPLPLGEVARAVGWSPSTLHLRFRQEVGASPGEYYLRQRVLAAAFDLGASPSSVSEIAHEFGFSSSQYFATAFRRVLGVSPSTYRQAHLDNAQDAPYAVELAGEYRF